MENLINQLGIGDTFKIKSIMAVEGLMNYDMIYVYHHLSAGIKVGLTHAECALNGDPIYVVKYKGFKLGTVVLTGVIKSFYQNEKQIIAEISAVSKDKYLPINKLDIALGVTSMKKAS